MKHLILLNLLLCALAFCFAPAPARAQDDDKKGDLEDFADDYDDDDSGDDDGGNFFLYVLIENFDDFVRLWGGTPETAFGPYPSFPYQQGEGFMAGSENYRSYFFNTEVAYHQLNSDLRSYLFKWETQFVGRSKLSFDLSAYQENISTPHGPTTDHLTLMGIRYGYAIFRSPQMMLNLEGGFRGLYRNGSHSGPELALDLQLFPKKPLIIETEVSAAFIEGSPLYIVDASAGLAVGRFEILGGMRILKNGAGDLLDGFRVGLRVWY